MCPSEEGDAGIPEYIYIVSQESGPVNLKDHQKDHRSGLFLNNNIYFVVAV